MQQSRLDAAYRDNSAAFSTVAAANAGSRPRNVPPAEIVRRLAVLYGSRLKAGDPIGRLRIPLIDLDRLVQQGVRGSASLDPDSALLRNGPVHYGLTPLPGAGEPFAVEGEGTCEANDQLDRVRAEVTFDDGFTAVFDSSRVAAAPQRTMSVVYPSGTVRMDFISGAFENTTPFALDAGFAATPEGRDRLGASLWAFLRAARGEIARPLADARDGVRALDLAMAVQQAVAG